MNDMSQAEIKIDIEGDVILELPMIPSGKMHLLVSSKVLSFVSPVLAKMFAWEFRSCPSDSPSKIPVIPFPEDDLEVLTLLCRIAHYKIDDLPKEIPLDLLVKFATTCDKYDCVRTVSHTSFRWLKIDINDHSSVDLNRLLYCAYVLDIPEAFEDISKRIVMTHCGAYDSLPGFTDQVLAPISILGKLHKFERPDVRNRNDDQLTERKHAADFHRTKVEIGNEITDTIQRAIHAAAKGECAERGRFVVQYICDLAQKNLWPISERLATCSLEDVILITLPKPPEAMYCQSSTCNFCRNRKDCSVQSEFDKQIATWESWFICLDCVRTGRASFGAGKCRVKHDPL